MNISQEQARNALNEAHDAQALSAKLHSYLIASPHLLLWGSIWAIGFGLSQLRPERSGTIWLALDAFGVLAGFAIAWRQAGRSASTRAMSLRFAGIGMAIFIFFLGSFFILRPSHPEQIAAFIALTFSIGYAIGGLLWRRTRIALTGAVLALVTLFGYTQLGPQFFAWMAVAGGGVLVAAGIWLKRI